MNKLKLSWHPSYLYCSSLLTFERIIVLANKGVYPVKTETFVD